MPLDTEVDLGPGHIVFDGAQLPPSEKGHSSPPLQPMFIQLYCGQTVAHLSYYMIFEDKIKTTFKEVTENSDASWKNLKSELKNKLRCRRRIVEKSQSQSKKFNAIDVLALQFLLIYTINTAMVMECCTFCNCVSKKEYTYIHTNLYSAKIVERI